MERVWAVVPVKGFDRAKTRLAPVLDAAGRRELARSLAERVLRTLWATELFAGILVCTDSDEVSQLAASFGARVRRDEGEPLNQIIDAALNQLQAREAEAALVMMADLPHITVPAVTSLTRSMEHGRWVMSPDRREDATNALGLPLGALLPTAFGRPGSFQRHQTRAAANGFSVKIIRDAALALDIDLPEDYELSGLSPKAR